MQFKVLHYSVPYIPSHAYVTVVTENDMSSVSWWFLYVHKLYFRVLYPSTNVHLSLTLKVG